jgi:hypothetical protein
MIPLRRFTEQGIARFAMALDQIKREGNADIEGLLVDEHLTQQLSSGPILQVRPFENRREAAEYFDEVLGSVEAEIVDVERDRGLWACLAATWMDEIAPLVGGRRNIGEPARWIPVIDNHQKYHRHLLAGPYRIYRAHRDDPDRAMALLATPVSSPGEVVEQFASRQDIVRNSNLLQTITYLYYDPNLGRLKRGAASKGAGGGGGGGGGVGLGWGIRRGMGLSRNGTTENP